MVLQHKKIKYIRVITLLATLIVIIGFLHTPVYASEKSENGIGLRHPEAIRADTIEVSQIYDKKASASYSSNWDSYSNYYYYNQMESNEKKLYDKLNTMCLSYMTGSDNFEDYVEGQLITKYVFVDGLTLQEAADIIEIFIYSNPQYYFLTNGYGYYSLSSNMYDKTYYIALCVYDEFKSGATRKGKTDELAEKIQEYYKQIDSQDSEFEKEKTLHDLLCSKVSYEFGEFDQSIYSVFFQQESVCAGYAKAYALLCNGQGIDTVVVTSDLHAWNKVRINDSWYVVDCTWNDYDVPGRWGYTFFNRSQAMITNLDSSENHEEENLWESYGPICTIDSGADDVSPGKVNNPVNQTEKPEISLKYGDSFVEVTLSSGTKGAVIYYTLNNKEPSEAYSKSFRYRSTFIIKATQKLQVVAIYNGFKDSQVVTQNVTACKYNAVTPVIATQPISKAYTYGSRPTALKVAVSPVNMVNLSYQWYVKSSPTGVASLITGATKSYLVPPASKSGTKYYYCKVTNRDETALVTKTSSRLSTIAKVVISPAAVTSCKVNGIVAKTYTGKAVTQVPKLIYGGKVLVKNTDYTLSYSANKAIGRAKCIVTGKGNFKGTKTIYFNINPPKTSISSAKKGSKKVTLKWKRISVVKGYQIQYSYKSNFSSAKIVTKNGYQTNSYTLKKLKSNKYCFIRIRTYKIVSGVKYYSSWSTALKIKIK